MRYLDVALVALAAIPALALGAPVFGYAVGAVAWILQRVIAATDKRLVDRVDEPVRRLGYAMFEAFGRIWLLAGGIVIAGVAGHRSDGLTAAIVIFGAYSIAFVIRLASGRPPPRETG
ncbi:MAG TPA: hypothetical protein VG388_00965 [Solirubrobacteraceae bacterium]|nr:hypothetical protein [Solirubrobacteraceae bacterium]